MRRAIVVALGTGVVISGAAALGIAAANGARPGEVDSAAYERARAGIAVQREKALARCDTLAGRGRDYCRIEAQSAESVQVADLEAHYRKTEPTARAAQRARIEARYELARAKCDEQRGFRRDRCLISAHADRGRALLATQGPYERRLRS